MNYQVVKAEGFRIPFAWIIPNKDLFTRNIQVVEINRVQCDRLAVVGAVREIRCSCDCEFAGKFGATLLVATRRAWALTSRAVSTGVCGRRIDVLRRSEIGGRWYLKSLRSARTSNSRLCTPTVIDSVPWTFLQFEMWPFFYINAHSSCSTKAIRGYARLWRIWHKDITWKRQPMCLNSSRLPHWNFR